MTTTATGRYVATNDALLESRFGFILKQPSTQTPGQMSAEVDQDEFDPGWASVVDLLMKWYQDPKQLEDEGLLPISIDRIADAINLAAALRKARKPAPSLVLPNTEGGISFELRRGAIFEEFEIDACGACEFRAFKDGHLAKTGTGRVSQWIASFSRGAK